MPGGSGSRPGRWVTVLNGGTGWIGDATLGVGNFVRVVDGAGAVDCSCTTDWASVMVWGGCVSGGAVGVVATAIGCCATGVWLLALSRASVGEGTMGGVIMARAHWASEW